MRKLAGILWDISVVGSHGGECRRSASVPRVLLMADTSFISDRTQLTGIATYARAHGPWELYYYNPLVLKASPESLVGKGEYDGIIVFYDQLDSNMSFLRKQKCPVLLYDAGDDIIRNHSFLKRCAIMRTNLDSVVGVAANHLVSKGVRNFAFVNDILDADWSRRRGRVFARQLKDRGFDCHVYWRSSKAGAENDTIALESFLRRIPKPVMVWCARDFRAVQVIRLCQRIGARVPDDVAVLGMDDDVFICESVSPHCSSIRMKWAESGETAAALLDRMMKGEHAPLYAEYYAMQIAERESTDVRGEFFNPTAKRIKDFIRQNAHRPFNVSKMLRTLCLKRRSAEMHFREAYGHSILQDLGDARYAMAEQLFKDRSFSLGEIASRCGYSSERNLRNAIKIKAVGKNTQI